MIKETDIVQLATDFTHDIVEIFRIDSIEDTTQILQAIYETLNGKVKEIIEQEENKN